MLQLLKTFPPSVPGNPTILLYIKGAEKICLYVCVGLQSERFILELPSIVSGVTEQEVHPIISVNEIVAVLARVVNED